MPDDRDMIVGARIRTAREAHGLSRSALAMTIRVSEKSIQNWERGTVRPTFRSLHFLSKALNMKPADFSAEAVKQRALSKKSKGHKNRTIVRNKKQVIFYSRLVIYSLEQALEVRNTDRLHNQPPSDLIIDDDRYIEEIRNLVAELKQLNELLEVKRVTKPKPIIEVKKHLNTFLQKWTSTVAIGTGLLTVGAMIALLHQLGVSDAMLDPVMKKFPLR